MEVVSYWRWSLCKDQNQWYQHYWEWSLKRGGLLIGWSLNGGGLLMEVVS